MIHVSRELVRSCVAVLSPIPGWQHPLRSLIELIYGLNSLDESFPLLKYRKGFLRPSESVKALKGLRGRCETADKSRNADPLLDRLVTLEREGSDTFSLLLFQVARIVNTDHPEQVVNTDATRELLFDLARTYPWKIAELAEISLKQLDRIVRKGGRGGKRNSGNLVQRQMVFELGVVFERTTGRKPGITFDPITGNHTGPFVEFCRVVFEAYNLPISGRRVQDIFTGLEIQEWRSPRKNRQSWVAAANYPL